MDKIFNDIEAGKLQDAKESLASALAVKVAVAIDAMRETIAGVLTKEDLDEDDKKITLPPHLQKIADKHNKDFGYNVTDVTPKGFGPDEKVKDKKVTKEDYEDHLTKIVDTNGKEHKSSMTADKSRHGMKVGAILDKLMLKAKLNTKYLTLDDLKDRSPRGQGKANEEAE